MIQIVTQQRSRKSPLARACLVLTTGAKFCYPELRRKNLSVYKSFVRTAFQVPVIALVHLF